MCVIAGYLGQHRAAPILIEMMKREEGLAGGYYTGIATIHEGVLHYEKVVGDVATLLRETPALDLPGTIGVIHSRTPGGGGRAWSHPFISGDGKLAYIANGSRALYEHIDFPAAALRLYDLGYGFESAQPGPVGRYPVLPDGRAVHFSDVVCQAASAAYHAGEPSEERLIQAAIETYERFPGSLVGLFLHADHPDEIAAVRYNKPLEIGRMGDGSIVMASTSLAFPDGVCSKFKMPHLCGARIARHGGITLRPFTSPDLLPIGPLPSAAAQADIFRRQVASGDPVSVRALTDAFVPLWPKDLPNEKEVVCYELLRALVDEGRIELRNHSVPGMEGQGTAPQTFVYVR